MPIGMLLDQPGGTREQYESFNRQMFGGSITPDRPPEGLVLHTAGPTSDGWRIFDVWESREDLDRFMSEKVFPAIEALGIPADGPQPDVYELDYVAQGTLAAVR
jgi:hypothetical protein